MEIKFLENSSGLKIGLVIFKDITIEKSNKEIFTLMQDTTNKIREKYTVMPRCLRN